MTPTEACKFSGAFATALGGAHTPPAAPAALLGLEHEYRLLRDGQPIDFRELIHELPVPGRRLDPGDSNAYRCASGIALTCDDGDAEIASPPVRLRPGFSRVLQGWETSGRVRQHTGRNVWRLALHRVRCKADGIVRPRQLLPADRRNP